MIALTAATTPRFARKACFMLAYCGADVINLYFHCPACAAGWSEDGGGFCEAPVEFETKCATSYNFAEVQLPTALRAPVSLLRCTLADGFENQRGARHVEAWRCTLSQHVDCSLLGQHRLVASIGNARPAASRTSGLQACVLLAFFVGFHAWLQQSMPRGLERSADEPWHVHGASGLLPHGPHAILNALLEAPPTYAGAFSQDLTTHPPVQDKGSWDAMAWLWESCPIGNPSERRT